MSNNDRLAKQHILNAVEFDEEGETLHTNAEKINCITRRFSREYGWAIEREGRQTAMQNWLMGLALNVEFYNNKILELAISWGSLPADYTEKQADKILDNYWPFMAAKTLQLIDGYRVPREAIECSNEAFKRWFR